MKKFVENVVKNMPPMKLLAEGGWKNEDGIVTIKGGEKVRHYGKPYWIAVAYKYTESSIMGEESIFGRQPDNADTATPIETIITVEEMFDYRTLHSKKELKQLKLLYGKSWNEMERRL